MRLLLLLLGRVRRVQRSGVDLRVVLLLLLRLHEMRGLVRVLVRVLRCKAVMMMCVRVREAQVRERRHVHGGLAAELRAP